MLNGLPSLVIDHGSVKRGYARRGALQIEVGNDGLVRAVYAVVAIRKLTAVRAI